MDNLDKQWVKDQLKSVAKPIAQPLPAAKDDSTVKVIEALTARIRELEATNHHYSIVSGIVEGLKTMPEKHNPEKKTDVIVTVSKRDDKGRILSLTIKGT